MRLVFVPRCLPVLLIAVTARCAQAAPAAADAPGIQLVLDLSDGSRVIGAPAVEGGLSDDPTHSFLGMMDEVAVFDRPLSGDEVKAVYDSQK